MRLNEHERLVVCTLLNAVGLGNYSSVLPYSNCSLEIPENTRIRVTKKGKVKGELGILMSMIGKTHHTALYPVSSLYQRLSEEIGGMEVYDGAYLGRVTGSFRF